jgi:hypothetical protein
MASRRFTVQDFIAQVNAQTPGVVSSAVYQATLNTDGTVKITKNAVQIYAKVLWNMGTQGAITDSNLQGDRVVIFQNDASVGSADAQLFINSLN